MHAGKTTLIKGLMYKSFILNFKEMLSRFIVAIIFILFGTLVSLGIKYGNSAGMGSESLLSNPILSDMIIYVSPMFIYMSSMFITLAFISVSSTIGKDKKSGWIKFQYASPLNEKEVAASEYLVVAIGWTIGVILSVANMALFYAILGQNVSQRNISVILLITIICVLCNNYKSIIIKIFPQNIAVISSSLIVFICFAAFFILNFLFGLSIDDLITVVNMICDKIIFFVVPVFLIINTASYFITVALFKRRKVV